MFRDITSRQLALNILSLINKIRLIENPSNNPPLFEITSLLNINHSLLSWACGRAKPSSPTIKNIIEVITRAPEGELKEQLTTLFKQFYNIWKIEIKYTNSYLEELVQKC